MAMIDIPFQHGHGDGFEEEMYDRHVEQAEQEEECGAEVEGQQSVPFHQRQGMAVELLPDVRRDVSGTGVFLAQQGDQPLELGCGLLLLARVVDV